jgi:hypothetical protein
MATFVDYYGAYGVVDEEENPTYVVLKEKIISDCIAIVMPANSFLLNAFNERITQMIESGIMEKIFRTEAKKPEESQPVVLSIDHLLIWFMLWAGLLLIAGAVFVCEVIARKLPKIIKKSSKTSPGKGAWHTVNINQHPNR